MKHNQRQQYISPHIEVIHLENESVIAGSGNLGDLTNKDWGSTNTYNGAKSNYNASSNDLEDLINDILTFEE